MQVFANIGTAPARKISKTTQRVFTEFRICESQKGDLQGSATWYTVRVMKDLPNSLQVGDFVKVTGKLKADYYLSREGKPTGTLLIIAFEASKIARPSESRAETVVQTQPVASPT